jgi:thiosulfate dehydrogenase (quinone) large subunit
MKTPELRPAQQGALVLLRTLIGWHFLYEGFYKLWWPSWSHAGVPLAKWTAAGYLKAATGPLAGLAHTLAGPPWIGWVDLAVAVGLVLVGLSLMLGLFTQAGCWGALALLGVFYVTAVPLAGVPQPGTEGAYLIVNKNLVEAAAVLAILVFRTGRIAGLDGLRVRLAAPAQEPIS